MSTRPRPIERLAPGHVLTEGRQLRTAAALRNQRCPVCLRLGPHPGTSEVHNGARARHRPPSSPTPSLASPSLVAFHPVDELVPPHGQVLRVGRLEDCRPAYSPHPIPAATGVPEHPQRAHLAAGRKNSSTLLLNSAGWSTNVMWPLCGRTTSFDPATSA